MLRMNLMEKMNYKISIDEFLKCSSIYNMPLELI